MTEAEICLCTLSDSVFFYVLCENKSPNSKKLTFLRAFCVSLYATRVAVVIFVEWLSETKVPYITFTQKLTQRRLESRLFIRSLCLINQSALH